MSEWMIVRKESTSTKIKNYFKNMFFKIFNKNKTQKIKKEKKNNKTLKIKNKLSNGNININDIDIKELDPLIEAYKNSNNELKKKVKK